MKKIAFVIVYLGGKLPNYIDLYIETCRWNQSVNWIIFTDAETPNKKINNMQFFELSLERFNLLASSKLGMSIRLKKTYKLCDLKPAYGVIFEDYLKEYDFWGYCDFDIIWGNIKNFISDDVLSKYDIITSTAHQISGHCSLFKNIENINRIYEKNSNYKLAFAEPEDCFGFDEIGLGIIQFQGITETILNEEQKGAIKVYWKTMCAETYVPEKWRNYLKEFHGKKVSGIITAYACHWLQGRTFLWPWNKEVMYCHFRTWGNRWEESRIKSVLYNQCLDNKGFVIDKRSIHIPSRLTWTYYFFRRIYRFFDGCLYGLLRSLNRFQKY